jgi:hypothetical protein
MQSQSSKKGLFLGLFALLLLLLVGGGLFLLLNGTPKPASNSGPSSANTTQVTPTLIIAQATVTTSITQASPVKAEVGDTVVTLTWEPVGDATGYFVHRDGGRDALNAKPVAETRYMDIGLTNGRVYTYTIAPVIGGVEGPGLPAVQAIPNPTQ